jgi:hypothetical protein
VKWESRAQYPSEKGEDSLHIVLFTPLNPHEVSPLTFALKEDKNQDAIMCHFAYNDICAAIPPTASFIHTASGSDLAVASS